MSLPSTFVSLMAAIVCIACAGISPVAQALPALRIARFHGDRAAAISYTFDDGLRDQYTLAVPMLNEAGFKGTFFVIPGKTAETVSEAKQHELEKRGWGGICWEELNKMAAAGHEIASHTWSHRGLTKLTPGEVNAEFSQARDMIAKRIGRAPLTIAFPFNQSTPEIRAAVLKYHVAYRAYQTSVGGKSTVESLNTWADKLVHEKKWGIIMAHGIARGYAALSDPEIFREHLRYVKTRENDIWVDTFASVARYEKERDAATLTISRNEPGHIVCVCSGALDAVVYNVPLTIVLEITRVKNARAERAGSVLPVRIKPDAVQIDAAPAPQPITITWECD